MDEMIHENSSELIPMIDERIVLLNKLKDTIQKEMESLPNGKLHVKIRGKNRAYYRRNESFEKNGSYIPKKKIDIAKGLAMREYDSKLLREVNRQLYHLNNEKIVSLENIYDCLSEGKKELINPIIQPLDQYIENWISLVYETRSFDGITTEYYTDNDERVRSKSEILIANSLKKMNVPYRYEYPHCIDGLGDYHPDFTCLNTRLRKEIIWEHFGMMSDSSYVQDTVYKINKLTLAGLYFGKDYIFTMESENMQLNTKVVEKMISKYLK